MCDTVQCRSPQPTNITHYTPPQGQRVRLGATTFPAGSAIVRSAMRWIWGAEPAAQAGRHLSAHHARRRVRGGWAVSADGCARSPPSGFVDGAFLIARSEMSIAPLRLFVALGVWYQFEGRRTDALASYANGPLALEALGASRPRVVGMAWRGSLIVSAPGWTCSAPLRRRPAATITRRRSRRGCGCGSDEWAGVGRWRHAFVADGGRRRCRCVRGVLAAYGERGRNGVSVLDHEIAGCLIHEAGAACRWDDGRKNAFGKLPQARLLIVRGEVPLVTPLP